MEKLDAILTSV